MTYLLQNDEDILNFHEFDSEQEARDFAQENIIQEDLIKWTLFDPEGMVLNWCSRSVTLHLINNSGEHKVFLH